MKLLKFRTIFSKLLYYSKIENIDEFTALFDDDDMNLENQAQKEV